MVSAKTISFLVYTTFASKLESNVKKNVAISPFFPAKRQFLKKTRVDILALFYKSRYCYSHSKLLGRSFRFLFTNACCFVFLVNAVNCLK